VVEDTLTPGLFISGRFRLKRLLGRGGMGSVWSAHHLTLEKDVAIKFLEPRWSSSEDARWRFAQEAIAVARMKSPHVVSVLDYGFTEQNRAFIVMELLHGEDLGQRLARSTSLSLEETCNVVTQTCRGLEKSHSLGVIHRDLKPENLFLSDEEGMVVKLLDFGVAKAVGMSAESHITDTGQIVGTPLYMSPEQALGRLVDTRSDLYSLAVIAYRCLAGRLPFMGKQPGELIVALSMLTPPAPSGFVRGLPASLDSWFASMFRKDPDARCAQTATELASSFVAACQGRFADPEGDPAGLLALSKATAPTLIASLESEQVGRSSDGVVPQSGARRSRKAALWRLALLVPPPVVGALFILWQHDHVAPRTLPPAALQVAPGASPAPAEAPRKVLLSLRVNAPDASIYLDGTRIGDTPFAGLQPLDGSPHTLRVEAPGHVTLEREIRLERDLQVELVMSPLPAPAEVPRTIKKLRASKRPDGERAATSVAPPRAPLEPPEPAPPTVHAEEAHKRRPLELDRNPPWQSP
jgi:eukaryotic-like serine/threonine-protein kinase